MTPEEQRTLDLFEAVESRPDINQRQIAEELGISLGLANAFLKTILNKGMDSCTQGQGTSLVILSHSPGKFGEKPTHPELPATHPEIIQRNTESS